MSREIDWSTLTLTQGSQVKSEWEEAVGTGSTVLDGGSPRTLVPNDYGLQWFRGAGATAMFPQPSAVHGYHECRCPCDTNPCSGPIFIDYGASSGSINYSRTETYYDWDGAAWVVDSTVTVTDNGSLAGEPTTATRYPHDNRGKCWASIEWTTGGITFTLIGDTATIADGNGSLVTSTGDFALTSAQAYEVTGSDSGTDDYWERLVGADWVTVAGLPPAPLPGDTFYRRNQITWSGSFAIRYAAKEGLL